MKGYVLIIGATSDIARPLAHLYAAAGYDLYLASTQPDMLTEECARLKAAHGVDAKPLRFDLLYFNGHEKFFHRLEPRPVGVICLGGYLGDHGLATADMEEVSRIIQINFVGPVSILNVAADCYEKQRSGFIVGIGPALNAEMFGNRYFFAAAKAALDAYLAGLRTRLSSSGVRVLTVKAGFTATKTTAGIPFPPSLTARPEEVARDIFLAQQKGRDVIYAPRRWRWLTWMHAHLPNSVFKMIARQR